MPWCCSSATASSGPIWKRTRGASVSARRCGFWVASDLATIYAATDVFALTSRNEGTPVALIETMASGVPGVSTDVGGVRDVILDRTMGVRAARRPPAFADNVLRLLTEPLLRAEMGARGRRHVLDRFDIERLTSDVARLYHELIGGA